MKWNFEDKKDSEIKETVNTSTNHNINNGGQSSKKTPICTDVRNWANILAL